MKSRWALEILQKFNFIDFWHTKARDFEKNILFYLGQIKRVIFVTNFFYKLPLLKSFEVGFFGDPQFKTSFFLFQIRSQTNENSLLLVHV